MRQNAALIAKCKRGTPPEAAGDPLAIQPQQPRRHSRETTPPKKNAAAALLPLQKMRVTVGRAISLGSVSSSPSVPYSVSTSRMGREGESLEMYAMSARFFTRPTACPSGVSAGQTMPQCELWSCRGLACFPSRPRGVLSRRRCEREAA